MGCSPFFIHILFIKTTFFTPHSFILAFEGEVSPVSNLFNWFSLSVFEWSDHLRGYNCLTNWPLAASHNQFWCTRCNWTCVDSQFQHSFAVRFHPWIACSQRWGWITSPLHPYKVTLGWSCLMYSQPEALHSARERTTHFRHQYLACALTRILINSRTALTICWHPVALPWAPGVCLPIVLAL